MSFFDKIELILDQLALLCCNPTLIIILIPFSILALAAFTMKGLIKRFQRIRNAKLKNRIKFLCYLLLAIYVLFLPFLLLDALGFFALSKVIVPILVIVSVILFIVTIPLLFFVFLVRNWPRILRWIWMRIGLYGERLLNFIESSPGLVPKSIRKFWSWLKTELLVFFNNHQRPRLLANPDFNDFLSVFGIYTESFLEQYAHSPYIAENIRYDAVKGLWELGATQNLKNLGIDTTASDFIRSSAGNRLEQLNENALAIQTWIKIGRINDPLRQLEACNHLVNLGAFSHASRILDKVLPIIGSLDAWHQLQAWYLHERINHPPNAINDLEQIALTADDASVGMKCADYLIELGHLNRALNVLMKFATDQSVDTQGRRWVISYMRTHNLEPGLRKLVSHPALSAELHFHVALMYEILMIPGIAYPEYQRIANTSSFNITLRVCAAEAKLRIRKLDETRILLCQLATDARNDYLLRIKIAQILYKAGWKADANKVLIEVYNDPGAQAYQKQVRDELEKIQ